MAFRRPGRGKTNRENVFDAVADGGHWGSLPLRKWPRHGNGVLKESCQEVARGQEGKTGVGRMKSVCKLRKAWPSCGKIQFWVVLRAFPKHGGSYQLLALARGHGFMF